MRAIFELNDGSTLEDELPDELAGRRWVQVRRPSPSAHRILAPSWSGALSADVAHCELVGTKAGSYVYRERGGRGAEVVVRFGPGWTETELHLGRDRD